MTAREPKKYQVILDGHTYYVFSYTHDGAIEAAEKYHQEEGCEPAKVQFVLELE